MKVLGLALAVRAWPLALPVVIAQTTSIGPSILAANAVDQAPIRTLKLATTWAVVTHATDSGK